MVIREVARIPQIQRVATRQAPLRKPDSAPSMWLDSSMGIAMSWMLKSSIWKGNVFNART